MRDFGANTVPVNSAGLHAGSQRFGLGLGLGASRGLGKGLGFGNRLRLGRGIMAQLLHNMCYKRTRPLVLRPGVKVAFGRPAHPVFPSDFSCLAHLIALLLPKTPGHDQRYGASRGCAPFGGGQRETNGGDGSGAQDNDHPAAVADRPSHYGQPETQRRTGSNEFAGLARTGRRFVDQDVAARKPDFGNRRAGISDFQPMASDAGRTRPDRMADAATRSRRTEGPNK